MQGCGALERGHAPHLCPIASSTTTKTPILFAASWACSLLLLASSGSLWHALSRSLYLSSGCEGSSAGPCFCELALCVCCDQSPSRESGPLLGPRQSPGQGQSTLHSFTLVLTPLKSPWGVTLGARRLCQAPSDTCSCTVFWLLGSACWQQKIVLRKNAASPASCGLPLHALGCPVDP